MKDNGLHYHIMFYFYCRGWSSALSRSLKMVTFPFFLQKSIFQSLTYWFKKISTTEIFLVIVKLQNDKRMKKESLKKSHFPWRYCLRKMMATKSTDLS